MPAGYISSTSSRDMVPWSRALELLERAPGYWLGTTDPDGRPHLVQQWGAWVHEQLFFEGSPDTRWARNLARDPRAVISVERGSEIVIVYGTVTLGARAERNVLEEVSRAYAKKYGRVHKYKPTAEEIEKRGINALVPSKALSWDVKTFGKSPTRFYFDTARAS
ncbi:MAG: hypothetical protein AUH85_09700 [Chloroflexi bacterium 13_1_40CM_4_68_4]|nr:MAG: hypothetical protein AUH85_09700 [Chloroflexi bacterium 13_1_40CM_4_68_4]